MSGARGFYLLTETIKTNLLADENVNTVTTGDITKIDLSKQTIYPLSHIIINNVSQEDQVLRFNISVFCMDIVDVSKEETTDIFKGNNNEHDVLNTQLQVVNDLQQELRRGDAFSDNFQVTTSVSAEPLIDTYENELAGWGMTVTIEVPTNELSLC